MLVVENIVWGPLPSSGTATCQSWLDRAKQRNLATLVDRWAVEIRGGYRKVGSCGHKNQQARKPRESCGSRVRPGEHRTPGAWQNRREEFALFTKSAQDPS